MKYAEYVQQLRFLKVDLDHLKEILDSRPISRWAFLVHDKDQNEDGSPKEPHLHIMMALPSDQTPENICKWFEDRPSQIEKGKKKQKTYENMCSYLIHETPCEDGKYHYDPTEVTANFDFVAFIEQIRKEVQEHKSKSAFEDILIQITENKIPRLKLDQYVSSLDRIKHAREIKEAYSIRDERLAKEVNRAMNVSYFYGASGTGKTTLAKFLAQQKGYSVFVSGSSNDPLEGYQGQECIILDDIRGSDWKINDLLKFLDNNTNSLVKSRYSNKLMNDCKWIILTSVQSLNDLYSNLRESQSEPITQLKRRCRDLIKFTPSTIEYFEYDEKEKDYVYKGDAINPVHSLLYLVKHQSMLNDIQNMVSEFAKGVVNK